MTGGLKRVSCTPAWPPPLARVGVAPKMWMKPRGACGVNTGTVETQEPVRETVGYREREFGWVRRNGSAAQLVKTFRGPRVVGHRVPRLGGYIASWIQLVLEHSSDQD